MLARNIARWPVGWIVFILALSARLIYLVSIQKLFPPNIFSGDGFLFDYYAWAWAQGTLASTVGMSIIPLPPLYIMFLGILYKCFGHEILIPQIIQAILGSVGCVLLYKIATRLWNKEVGFFAGIIAAFYSIFIFYDLELLKFSLINVLLITTLWLLLCRRPVGLTQTMLSAVSLSLAMMMREQLLILYPLIVVWILMNNLKEGKGRALALSALFLVIVISLPPLINGGLSRLLPKHSGFVATSGIHFYIGNHSKANGTYKPIQGISPFPIGHLRDAKLLAEKSLGRRLTNSEVNRYWLEKSFKEIEQNPTAWLKLELRKAFLILNSYEIPNDDYPYVQGGSWFMRLPLFSYAIICPLGLLGMILQLRKKCMAPNFLITCAVAYSATLLLTFVTAGYRLPLQIFMLLFSALSIFAFKELIRLRKIRRFLLLLVVLLPFCLIANAPTYLNQQQYQEKIKIRILFLNSIKGKETETLYRLLNT